MASRCEWCEFPFYPEEFQLLEEPLRANKGKIKALEKPGLGIEIDKEMFEKSVLKI